MTDELRIEDKLDGIREQIAKLQDSFNAQFRSVIESINSNNTVILTKLTGLERDFEAHKETDRTNHDQQDKDIGRAFTALKSVQEDVSTLKDVHQQGKGAALAWKIAGAILGAAIGGLELVNLLRHP